MSAVGIGVIGVGVISDTYLENLGRFPDTEVLIVGDLLLDRAQSQAEKHGVPAYGSADDVLAHPGVDLVINLTIPAVHIEVSRAAIAAGKHVWTEKPLGLDREQRGGLQISGAERDRLRGELPRQGDARLFRGHVAVEHGDDGRDEGCHEQPRERDHPAARQTQGAPALLHVLADQLVALDPPDG